jgi:hypothetical protein
VAIIRAQSKGEEDAIQWTVIDPATEQHQTAGGVIQRIIDQYREAGLPCRKGNNAIPDSITLLLELLRPDPERKFPRWHHQAGEYGSPRLFFAADCQRLRWEVEQWSWMDIKPGQIDRQKVRAENDDLVACLRYLVMERPMEARVAPQLSAGERIEQMLAELSGERDREEWIGEERVR